MKKVLMSTLAAMTLVTGASAVAYAEKGPNEFMVKMFAMSQDMTDYQQELAVDVFQQVKTLAETVKSPQDEVKTYLSELVEKDRIDVDEVMAHYKQWQQQVDAQFEQSLVAVAKLHTELTVDQRQKLVENFRRLRSGAESDADE